MTGRIFAILFLGGCLLVATPVTARAANPMSDGLHDDIVDATRELETARIRLRQFDDIEYPLAVRKLETRIRLAEAELATWRARLREYQTFDRWNTPSGFLITLDESRLNIRQLERGIDDLKQEKFLLQKGRSDERRLLRIEAEAAARRLTRLRAQARAEPPAPSPG